jgi:creatinine amidohydrolase/Fe(II)-dependent formamide hydrolase-like protein
MDKTNQTTPRNEAQDDIIVLGVASVDTHGPGVGGEVDGIFILPGISKE